MAKNSSLEYSTANAAAVVDIQRSRFNLHHTHKTTFGAGKLIPIDWYEVLPGDTFKVRTSSLVRMSTPVFPVMDNSWLDIFFFYVPYRLIWDNYKKFVGETVDTPWSKPSSESFSIPQLTIPEGGFAEFSVADYLGIPPRVGAGDTISALPFRAYAMICNEWFRDQNVEAPLAVYTDDVTRTGHGGSDPYGLDSACLGGIPFTAAKYHDLFTSCLPSPQRGDPVDLPLGTSAPIKSLGLTQLQADDHIDPDTGDYTNPLQKLNFFVSSESQIMLDDLVQVRTNQTDMDDIEGGQYHDKPRVLLNSGGGDGNPVEVYTDLYADLNQATSATINSLRFAFAMQKYLERDARGGARYRELIQSHYGVSCPDYRAQIPEYLGGSHTRINVQQVLQTSSTNAISPQGNTAAYSMTSSVDDSFIKSFTEPGLIMAVAVVRTEQTYQQGLEKFWRKKTLYEFYHPEFANIGEQPVHTEEIFYSGASGKDTVFGYQEAWYEYRHKPSKISGAFRSDFTGGSLDAWHYAPDFASAPTLDENFIKQPYSEVARTLAVTSKINEQFIADFYFQADVVRPMPVYSIPGLLDHH